jgi:hypothetical protein
MLNAVTKITAMGFERGSHNAQYKRIVSNQIVPDFKQFSIGALASGNLINTPASRRRARITSCCQTVSHTSTPIKIFKVRRWQLPPASRRIRRKSASAAAII